jgi:hypothetical protein
MLGPAANRYLTAGHDDKPSWVIKVINGREKILLHGSEILR